MHGSNVTCATNFVFTIIGCHCYMPVGCISKGGFLNKLQSLIHFEFMHDFWNLKILIVISTMCPWFEKVYSFCSMHGDLRGYTEDDITSIDGSLLQWCSGGSIHWPIMSAGGSLWINVCPPWKSKRSNTPSTWYIDSTLSFVKKKSISHITLKEKRNVKLLAPDSAFVKQWQWMNFP